MTTGHDDHGHDGTHVLPLAIYMAVYGALLVLTVITVGVSYMGLGPLSMPAAMLVAVIKAALVIGFFMHLRYESRFLSVVFFSSVLFLSVFFGLTFTDLGYRGDQVREIDTFVLRNEAAAEAAADEAELAETASEEAHVEPASH